MSGIGGLLHSVGAAVERWTKPVTIVAGVMSLLWALLLIPVAKRTQSLVTWVRADNVVYPTDLTADRALPLVYDGIAASHARVVSVRVQNRGSSPIGSVEELWTLRFSAPTATHLILLDSARADPAPIALTRVSDSTAAPNAVAFTVGLLDPRISIELDFLLLNSRIDRVPLQAAASLVGLPHEVTMLAPDDRLAERYFWPWAAPVLLLLAVPMMPPMVREWWGRGGWKRVLYFPLYLVLALLALFLPAFLWVAGLAWLVSNFY